MMYDLSTREIKSNQRIAPRTKALADIATRGLDDVAAWLHDMLSSGVLPLRSPSVGVSEIFPTKETLEAAQTKEGRASVGDSGSAWRSLSPCWPYATSKDALFQIFASHTEKHNRYGRVRDRSSFFKRLRVLLPSTQEERPRINGKPMRIIMLPSLEVARDEFRRTTGLDFDFEETA
jgi:hypothetical protein